MDNHRPATPGAPVPPADDLRLTDPAAGAVRTAPAAPVIVDTQVPADQRIERTVEARTVQPEAPAVHTVVTEQAPRRAEESRPSRLALWLGGGTLTAGAVAAAVREVLRRRAEERAAQERRDAVESLAGPVLALAGTVASTAVAAAATRRRRRRQEDEAMAAVMPAPVLLGDPADEEVEPLDLTLAEEDDAFADAEVETVPLPVEARVLVETLLDPSLAEGRELPGAAALRAQLPLVRTVADALPASEDEEAATDWLPLVVDDEVERAVPHDFTWPVRGRFVEDGQTFELTLMVIDGELGALVVSPIEGVSSADWDEIPAARSWPGVHQLTFHVDGERRA